MTTWLSRYNLSLMEMMLIQAVFAVACLFVVNLDRYGHFGLLRPIQNLISSLLGP